MNKRKPEKRKPERFYRYGKRHCRLYKDICAAVGYGFFLVLIVVALAFAMEGASQ